jgi:hypothetical protein
VTQKFLCLCNGGVVRSVTLAAMLKYWFHEDALAASLDRNMEETLIKLYEWADKIVVAEGWMGEKVPSIFYHKVRLVPIGLDRWGMSNHPDLIAEIMRHDLPKILGVSKEEWDKREDHLSRWEEQKRTLQRNIMETILRAEKKCLRSMDPALRDAVVGELMYHLPS